MLSLSQPVAEPAARLTAVNWWPIVIRRGGYPYDFCILMRDEVLAAIQRALKSGVVEYHVGSRGLKRFTLGELQDALEFWIRSADDAALGISSAIQSRRAAPCDV